ncbi:MAG: hypothetical protein IKG93_13060 [Clostridiales bacterium]|nr:hypothetical protein [Clostridiales bacterium]
MKKSKRIMCALIGCTLVISMLGSIACKSKDETTGKESSGKTEETSSETTLENTALTEDTSSSEKETTTTEGTKATTGPAEPTPTPDPETITKNEAVAKAEAIGMKEEDLHGEYALFLEYLHCLEENPNLGGYRENMVFCFPIVAENISEENKEYFFTRLSTLRCETMPLGQNHAGEYDGEKNLIRIDELMTMTNTPGAANTTIAHEFTHFLDWCIHGERDDAICLIGEGDGKLIKIEDATDEQWALSPEIFTADFITEGGAELYSSKYIFGSPSNYMMEVYFLIGMEYIYGEETVRDLFFDTDSAWQFTELMRKCGYEDQKIAHVMRSFDYYTYPSRIERPEKVASWEDVLIDMYQSEKGDGWKDDKVFCYILQDFYSWYDEDAIPEFEHKDFKDLRSEHDEEYWREWEKKVIGQLSGDRGVQFLYSEPQVQIKDGKAFLCPRAYFSIIDDYFDNGTIQIEYDFENDKVLGCTFIEFPMPNPVPSPVSGEELAARRASLMQDPAEIHQQPEKPGMFHDLDDQYKKSTAIGNKYGVYLYLEDQIPEEFGVIGSSEVDPDRAEQALDKIDEILSWFPEGYFDGLHSGNLDGLVISLVNHTMDNESGVLFINGKYYLCIMLNYVSSESIGNYAENITREIFYFGDIQVEDFSQNLLEPRYSEENWRKLNPDDFSYFGNNGDTDFYSMYQKYQNYFVNSDGSNSARMDRATLMSELLLLAAGQRSESLTPECLKKAEYYSSCIRECFDTAKWPEKTLWEEKIDELKKTL